MSLKSANKKKGELYGILLSFKKTLFALGFFSFIINMLMIVPAVYMLQIYDRVLGSGNKTTLLMLTIIVVMLYLILAALEGVRGRAMIRAGNKMDSMTSSRVFEVAFKSALNGSSSNASQTFNDMTTLRQFLTGNGLFAFFDAPWAPIYLAIIYMIHPALGVYSTVAIILLVFLTAVTEWLSRSPLKESGSHYAQAVNFANKNFKNVEVIESMGMLDNVKRHWAPKHNAHIAWQALASERVSLIQAITKFVRIASQSLILGLGAYFVLRHEITPGMMIAGSIFMGRTLAPVELLIGTWKGFVNARGAYNRLEKLFEHFPREVEVLDLPDPKGEVSVNQLMAMPPGGRKLILQGVNFDAKKGEIVGVVGPSASGKSTLARLLVGAWIPYSGSVRLDGADIYRWNKVRLGPHIGYLPQDIELLEGSVSENIARFGDLDADLVVRAAMMAGVHDMILGFPQGYDTYIGEGGLILSGGQRQRIALARAIYGDPCLIILDEPNSNLDEAGELALVEALKHLKAISSTVFVITHKTNILNMVDKLMVLSDGTLKAYGPLEEVLRWLQESRARTEKPALN